MQEDRLDINLATSIKYSSQDIVTLEKQSRMIYGF
jgi:hypothetical protein